MLGHSILQNDLIMRVEYLKIVIHKLHRNVCNQGCKDTQKQKSNITKEKMNIT